MLYLTAVRLMPLGTLVAGVFATVLGIRETLMFSGPISGTTTLVPLFRDDRDPAELRSPSPRAGVHDEYSFNGATRADW